MSWLGGGNRFGERTGLARHASYLMLSGIHHTFAIGGGELNGQGAYGLFVCFVDVRTKTPTSGDEWR